MHRRSGQSKTARRDPLTVPKIDGFLVDAGRFRGQNLYRIGVPKRCLFIARCVCVCRRNAMKLVWTSPPSLKNTWNYLLGGREIVILRACVTVRRSSDKGSRFEQMAVALKLNAHATPFLFFFFF